MIYDIYIQGKLIIETDNLPLVKTIVKTNPGCSVKNAVTGKGFHIKYVKKTARRRAS